METIRFSTIYCSSAVISTNYLNLCGSFTSDMLPRLCWTVSGVPPLFRTAASRWILTGAGRSLNFFPCVAHTFWPYLRKSGGRTEAVQCRYCKGKTGEQSWKLKYLYFVLIHSWSVCLTPRTRLFPAASQDFFPLSLALWKLNPSGRCNDFALSV